MPKTSITSDQAPKAVGAYSSAVALGEWLFFSGQIGLDPATGEMVSGGVEAEARRVLDNLQALLQAAGVTTDAVVRTTIYLADIKDFQAVNAIYAEYFRAPYPARATVAVAALPRGARVEIDAIAVNS